MSIGDAIGHANVILRFRLWGGHKSELTAAGQRELELASAYANENKNDPIIRAAREYADTVAYLRDAKPEDLKMDTNPESKRRQYERAKERLARYLESSGVRIDG